MRRKCLPRGASDGRADYGDAVRLLITALSGHSAADVDCDDDATIGDLARALATRDAAAHRAAAQRVPARAGAGDRRSGPTAAAVAARRAIYPLGHGSESVLRLDEPG